MLLISLDLEDERPSFIEDPTFNVIPDIEDLLDAVSDFLEEDEGCEEDEEWGGFVCGVGFWLRRHAVFT